MSNININTNEAVVLLNMGGPNNLFEVETFLKNMFNDPLILTIKNSFIRKFTANMIVNSRLEKAKSNYKQIGSKSPLVEITFNLTKVLQELDNTRFYTYAMRYTPPYNDLVIKDLMDRNITKVTLFSMYPQYSNTTTLSSVREFMRCARELDFKAKINVVESYPTYIGFIESCIEKIKECEVDYSDYVLLLSAHSIPKQMVHNGDPYKNEIEKSAAALEERLIKEGINFKDIAVCYQSKIGPVKWLEPTTIDTIKEYKDYNIMIYPLAFSIDNSETIYELEIENRELANKLGIKNYIVCKCPNDSLTFAKSIIDLINLKGKSIDEAKI
ncbi:ferrochelatase [Helicobacter sp. MIT 99-5507]|uniref:ferrochelatase n=1 Tax=Helicobacter sp. MIT 99-5507 TaxID=152489 RepID=UPI002161D9D5|nr:ferrochelatase [Helicobacter sp. MIT 99-5507]